MPTRSTRQAGAAALALSEFINNFVKTADGSPPGDSLKNPLLAWSCSASILSLRARVQREGQVFTFAVLRFTV
jgi:hypothetical protein